MDKKFIALPLFLLLLASLAFADTGVVMKMESDYSFTPATVYSGDIVTLSVNFKNYSNSTVVDGLNVAINLSSHFEPLVVEEDLGTVNPGETKTANFQFRVKPETITASFKIPISMDYYNVNRNLKVSDADSVNLTVSSISRLDIRSVSLAGLEPYVGGKIIINAVVENTGTVELRDVKLKLDGNFSSFALLGDTQLHLGNIGVNESKPASFILRATEGTKPGTYSFDLNASFTGSTEDEKEKVSFEVKGKPQLILSGLDFSVEGRAKDKKVFQGDSFSLSVQLDNIGQYKAKAVSLELVGGQGIVGVKEAFVGNIDEDDSGAAVFDLSVSPSAAVGENKFDLEIEFINEAGEQEKITKTINLFIHQKPPESPVGMLILVIVVLVLVYFLVKMVFRQLAIRKATRV